MIAKMMLSVSLIVEVIKETAEDLSKIYRKVIRACRLSEEEDRQCDMKSLFLLSFIKRATTHVLGHGR
jgi:hypothetical protein